MVVIGRVRQADADADRHLPDHREVSFGDRHADLLGDDFRSVGFGDFRQQHSELFAAVTGDEIGGAQAALNQLRQLLQHIITHCVAVGIIDALEVIGIDQQQGERTSGAAEQQCVFGEFLVEAATVVNAGQTVVGRQAEQFGIGLRQRSGALRDGCFQRGIGLLQLALFAEQRLRHGINGLAELGNFQHRVLQRELRTGLLVLHLPRRARELFDRSAQVQRQVVSHQAEQHRRDHTQNQQFVHQQARRLQCGFQWLAHGNRP
ncbi:hypothetical protein D3C81_1170650 [compost metagenome]